MPPLDCPKCRSFPDIEKVERTIGELYRVSCCGMIAFGDPIQSETVDAYLVALQTAYDRWNEAVEETKR